VADVEHGLLAFSQWLPDQNPDVRWIVRQNLGKARLARVAPGFVRAAAVASAV
jgi:hypothetical protein